MSLHKLLDPCYTIGIGNHYNNTYTILRVERSSDGAIFNYKVDYNIIEYLYLFDWNLKSNRTVPRTFISYLKLGEKEAYLYRIILGIDPTLKNLKVIFLDGDNFNYMRSNLKVINSETNEEVSYYVFDYNPIRRNPIEVMAYTDMSIYGNYIFNYPIRKYNRDLTAFTVYTTQINYKFFYAVNQYSWKISDPIGNNRIYIVSEIKMPDGKSQTLHLSRLIYSLEHPEFNPFVNQDEYIDIDHIDRNIYNNTIENLRLVTRQQNIWNKSVYSDTTGSNYRNIYPIGNKYFVKFIRKQGDIFVGIFDTLEDAIIARDNAIKQYYGEYGNLIQDELSKQEKGM